VTSLVEVTMHVVALGSAEFAGRLDLLKCMFRLRRRVFKDRLNWDVSSSDGMEIDIFDAFAPIYLVVLHEGVEVIGCVRLLPTTGPTMLSDAFPSLLDGQSPPSNPEILESSRFCVDTNRGGNTFGGGLSQVTFLLFAAMIEYLCLVQARSIVTVTDLRMERILRRAGWPLERIGTPQAIGNTMALAGYLHRSEGALAAICQHARLERPILGELPFMPAML
jgi:acyl homoserine lactone synthase